MTASPPGYAFRGPGLDRSEILRDAGDQFALGRHHDLVHALRPAQRFNAEADQGTSGERQEIFERKPLAAEPRDDGAHDVHDA